MNRTPAGLYLPADLDPASLPVELAGPPRGDVRTLSGQIATRDRSWDTWSLSSWLPNPDPILKNLGRDIAVYRDLRSDGHVAACIRRRKSAVRGLEEGLEREGAPARVHKDIEAMLRDIDAGFDPDGASRDPGLDHLIAAALDGALYGYQPLEILWQRSGRYLAPAVVQGKPPEWFAYDADNRLRFRARGAAVEGELLPPRKFLVARQEPSYANPYGLADLSLIFWPASFRKGGAKFWTYWVEKYGGTFLVGKLPRSARPEDYDDLTQRLAEMVQDAVAAIPDDGSVEPLESASKAGSTDAHERYLRYWRSEITIALLGSNQGMETDSTHASASASLEVAQDIRDGDARMVEAVVNQLIRWTVELNWPGSQAPVWRLREQEEIDEARPRRDKLLVECGVRFADDYWLRTYDLEKSDLAEPEPGAPASAGRLKPALPGEPSGQGGNNAEAIHAPPALAEPVAAPDTPAQQADNLGRRAETLVEDMLATVRAELDKAPDLPTFHDRLATLYPELNSTDITELLGQAFAAADAAGRLEADA